jgi:putative peptidoglycan lipid II flippase
MALTRNIATIGTATLVSRLLGFGRDAGIAALFGSSAVAPAFFAVLQFINFFRRLLTEGAINGAFAPIWLRLRRTSGPSAADAFTRRVLLITGLITVLVAIGGFVTAPILVRVIAPGFDSSRASLAYLYLILSIPYVTLAGLAAILAAALNAESKVAAVAAGTVAFNVVLVTAVVIAFAAPNLDLTLAGAILAAGIVVAGFAQFAIVNVAWLWRSKRFAPAPRREPREVRTFFLRAAPGLISAGIPQLKLLAGAAIVSTSAVGVSWLYYANRLYELPLGLASVVIAVVIVPRIAASIAQGGAKTAQSRALEIALGLALPAAAGFALLAEPIAAGLFQRGAFTPQDSMAVASALAAICGGLPGHVLEKVLAAVSFAHEDTRTPMLTALCGLAAAIAGALLLFPHYGHTGVAAAIGISGWIGAGVLAIVLRGRRWLHVDDAAKRNLPRIVLATVLMAAVVSAARLALWPTADLSLARLAVLGVLVALGIAAYLASLQALRVARLSDIVAAIRDRA